MQKVTARGVDKSFIVGETEDKPVDLSCILAKKKDNDIELNNSQDINLMGYSQEIHLPALSLNISSYFMLQKGKVTPENLVLKNSRGVKRLDDVESLVRVINNNKIDMTPTLSTVVDHASHSATKESDSAKLPQLKMGKESSVKQLLPLSISEVSDSRLFTEIKPLNGKDILMQHQTVSNMTSDSQQTVLDKKSDMTVDSQLTALDTTSDIKPAEMTEQIKVGGNIKTVILHSNPLSELAQKPVAEQQMVKQAAPVMKTIPWSVSEKASGHEQVTEIGSGKLTYTFHDRASDSVKITYSNVAGQGPQMLMSPSNSDVQQQLQAHWPTDEIEANWLLKDRQHQSKQQPDHEEEEE